MNNNNSPVWKPSQTRVDNSNIVQFTHFINQRHNLNLNQYPQLYNFSIENMELFWDAVWDFCQIKGSKGEIVFSQAEHPMKSQFFPDAKINYAENLLSNDLVHETAIISRLEDKKRNQLSWQKLRNQVSILQQQLASFGVKKGDVVAGVVSNSQETTIAMLATASLGAVWTSCSPDFGVTAVLERFQQTKPKVLFATTAYYYKGKRFDCLDKIKAESEQLASVEQTIMIDDGEDASYQLQTFHSWHQLMQDQTVSIKPLSFTRVRFNDPLFILYSSGTTGEPKCIVHGVGGTLIEHLKELILHCDVKKKDRVFYATTCGWMMWNWQMSTLACQATLVLYDGFPFAAKVDYLFQYAEEEDVTLFGTSAKYLEELEKQQCLIQEQYSLSHLRTITVTGSPLAQETYHYVLQSIKADLHLASICGGTDLIGCFILGVPTLPVYAGEIQAISLGMQVDVLDDEGKSIQEEKGELVCKNAFPSMPICFWNDEDNQKYYRAYFDHFENIWTHGDYVCITKNKGLIVYGRSDATLNPGGVRIGTSEIYRQINRFPTINDAIIVGQALNNDVRIILFVVMQQGHALNDDLRTALKSTIRQECSPRHVPAKIIAVQDVPRTRSGKLSELAVRDIINNKTVKNKNALANPEALDCFKNLPELIPTYH